MNPDSPPFRSLGEWLGTRLQQIRAINYNFLHTIVVKPWQLIQPLTPSRQVARDREARHSATRCFSMAHVRCMIYPSLDSAFTKSGKGLVMSKSMSAHLPHAQNLMEPSNTTCPCGDCHLCNTATSVSHTPRPQNLCHYFVYWPSQDSQPEATSLHLILVGHCRTGYFPERFSDPGRAERKVEEGGDSGFKSGTCIIVHLQY